jgi:hypothetical protein
MAEPELIRRETSQPQAPQRIYITEVKRLLPGGQREKLQPSAAWNSHSQKTAILLFQAIMDSKGSEILR